MADNSHVLGVLMLYPNCLQFGPFEFFIYKIHRICTLYTDKAHG